MAPAWGGRSTVNAGMAYDVDLESGAFTLSASRAYREEYPRRRARDTGLPELDEHVAGLKAATLVWSRE